MPTEQAPAASSPSWFLRALHGNLNLRLSGTLAVGEDLTGELVLNPEPEESLIRLQRSSGELALEVLPPGHTLVEAGLPSARRIAVDEPTTLKLNLPHNSLIIAPGIIVGSVKREIALQRSELAAEGEQVEKVEEVEQLSKVNHGQQIEFFELQDVVEQEVDDVEVAVLLEAVKEEMPEAETAEKADETGLVEDVVETSEGHGIDDVDKIGEFDDSDQVDEADKIDQANDFDEVDKVNKVNKVNKVDEVDEVVEIDEVIELDALNEIDEIENNRDTSAGAPITAIPSDAILPPPRTPELSPVAVEETPPPVAARPTGRRLPAGVLIAAVVTLAAGAAVIFAPVYLEETQNPSAVPAGSGNPAANITVVQEEIAEADADSNANEVLTLPVPLADEIAVPVAENAEVNQPGADAPELAVPQQNLQPDSPSPETDGLIATTETSAATAETSAATAEAATAATEDSTIATEERTATVEPTVAEEAVAAYALDPDQQAAVEALLVEAELLYDADAVISPIERNAVKTLIEVLAVDPQNEVGLQLMYLCATRLLDRAQTAYDSGDYFVARNLVEEILWFHPEFEDARVLLRTWSSRESAQAEAQNG